VSSALQLNAAAVLLQGLGIAPNAALMQEIQTYRLNPSGAIQQWSTINFNTSANAVVASHVAPILASIPDSVVQGEFLIGTVPSGITNGGSTISSVGVSGAATYNLLNTANSQIPDVIGTLYNQARLPFGNVDPGVGGIQYTANFAGSYSSVRGFAGSTFDLIGTANILHGKTYSQAGLGYSGPVDLATGGVGANAPLLANVVMNWGTMYDVNQINLLADPYVFGQNLLNQGLGTVGNLSANLTATGLDTANISVMPTASVTNVPTLATTSVTSISSDVGQFSLPTVGGVQSSVTPTGNNSTVVLNIYKSITGANLTSIVHATGFSSPNTTWKTLADFLDITKVVDVKLQPQLSSLGINSMPELATYLSTRLGKNTFQSWKDVYNFLSNVQIPSMPHTKVTTSASPVLLPTVDTALSKTFPIKGTGDYGNYTAADLLGACAGNVYTAALRTINASYNGLSSATYTAFQNLNSAITACNTAYQLAVSNAHTLGTPNTATIVPDTSGVTTAATALINSVTASSGSSGYATSQAAYYAIVNKLVNEINLLAFANIKFNPGSNVLAYGFSQQFPSMASTDYSGFRGDALLANLITADLNGYGDTIHAAVAEVNNSASYPNDAKPGMALYNASHQGIPLKTYLSQNK